MKVLIAEASGACYGVDRALRIAHEATQGEGRVQTLGPLIHNPQVVAELEAQGAAAVDSVEALNCDKVVIRSHGVTPDVYDQIEAKGIELVDATCPHVMRAQRCAFELAQQGTNVIVVGEVNHPEVEGIAAWARRGGVEPLIVGSPDDIPHDVPVPVGIVVQTTQPRAHLDAVVEALSARGIEADVRDTICSATSERQTAARDLAAKVDAMVVVGGKNSSNTTRLFEICSEIAPRTIHIEGPDELDPAWFAGVETVGLTAGASTPASQIQAIVDLLQSY